MELSITVESAIIAQYSEHKFFLDWKTLNQFIHHPIVRGPHLGQEHGFSTQWTTGLILLKAFLHAMHVHGVPTRNHV